MYKIDLTGKQVNRLTATSYAFTNEYGQSMWNCVCVCGKTLVVNGGNLKSGAVKSCGCIRIKHGQSKKPLYAVWVAMKQRCTNPNHPRYSDWGGRGITVCERWFNSFANFYADMGDRPSKQYSLDRIDNDGNYELSNCKWSTRKEQMNNQRCSKKHKK